MCPGFDFIRNRFKPKPKSEHETPRDQNTNEISISHGKISTDQDQVRYPSKSISIEEALSHLSSIEDRETQRLVDYLTPIRASAQEGLRSIVDLADALQNEEIKVEDQRFESTVENARSTVITSILKDARTTFPEITSYNYAIKFKDQLDSLTNRFGQLTGSHSKLFNVFMKKYADKFRSEFEDFSNLNKKASKLINDYEHGLDDVKACKQKIDHLSSGSASLTEATEKIDFLTKEIQSLENEVEELTRRHREIKESDGYKDYAMLEAKAREIEKDKAEFRDYVSDLFSHLNRAFTKYSYGVSKSVSMRIETLSNSPWEIFLKSPDSVDDGETHPNKGMKSNDSDNIEAYKTLLAEVRGAVAKGTISLKDSDKVLTYLDKAIEIFPKIEARGREIQTKASSIRLNQNRNAIDSMKSLEGKILRNRSDIEEKKSFVEMTKNSLDEKRREIQLLTEECSNSLTELIGQERIITTTA